MIQFKISLCYNDITKSNEILIQYKIRSGHIKNLCTFIKLKLCLYGKMPIRYLFNTILLDETHKSNHFI